MSTWIRLCVLRALCTYRKTSKVSPLGLGLDSCVSVIGILFSKLRLKDSGSLLSVGFECYFQCLPSGSTMYTRLLCTAQYSWTVEWLVKNQFHLAPETHSDSDGHRSEVTRLKDVRCYQWFIFQHHTKAS